jgi:hypothetical protein
VGSPYEMGSTNNWNKLLLYVGLSDSLRPQQQSNLLWRGSVNKYCVTGCRDVLLFRCKKLLVLRPQPDLGSPSPLPPPPIYSFSFSSVLRITTYSSWLNAIFLFLFMFFIQHCIICLPSFSAVSEDAGIEPRTIARSHHWSEENFSHSLAMEGQ